MAIEARNRTLPDWFTRIRAPWLRRLQREEPNLRAESHPSPCAMLGLKHNGTFIEAKLSPVRSILRSGPGQGRQQKCKLARSNLSADLHVLLSAGRRSHIDHHKARSFCHRAALPVRGEPAARDKFLRVRDRPSTSRAATSASHVVSPAPGR